MAQAILHASLDRMSLSVRKFSRWLRALCTILLSRNSPADRAKAIGYVEQAVAVLREHSDAGDEQDVNQFSRNLLVVAPQTSLIRFSPLMSVNGSLERRITRGLNAYSSSDVHFES